MSDRLQAAIGELVAALRDELRADGSGVHLMSIPAAAERLGIGRTALYSEIQAGRIRTVKVGRRRLVPSDAISERAA